MADDIVDTIA